MIKEYINYKLIRPAVYAATLVLGLSVAFDQLESGNSRNFAIVVLIVSIVLIIEIYTSWSFYQLQSAQGTTASFSTTDRLTHWAQHLLLPAITFYAEAAFIYFNQDRQIRWLLYVIGFAVFSLLFYNLRSFFEQNKHHELVSHYVYDILKLYLVFLLNNVTFNMAVGPSRIILLFAVNFVLAAAFALLTFARRHSNFNLGHQLWLGFTILSMPIISTIAAILISINPLEFALVMSIWYYISNATYHHYTDKSLRASTILEYVLVLVIVFTIFLSS